MQVLGLGVHVLLALFFAVHAVRSRQEMYWLFILFMFPLLGSVVYAIAIWLPEVRHAAPVRQASRRLREAVDPDRRLREAQLAYSEAATVDSQLYLADALLEAGRASEALVHYQGALRGPFASDPDIQTRLAKALLESGRAVDARRLLQELIAKHPDFKSADGHLTFARAVAAAGDSPEAREEFDALLRYYPGLEAQARYIELLTQWGDLGRATELRDDALARAKRLPRHTREHERRWLEQLQRSVPGGPQRRVGD